MVLFLCRPRKPLFKAPVRERKGSVDFISQISDYSQHSSAEKHTANTDNIQEINGGNDFTSNDFFNSQYPDVTDTPQVITLNRKLILNMFFNSLNSLVTFVCHIHIFN